MGETIRVGTRRSPLAKRQTELVVQALRERWPSLEIRVETIETSGDRFAGAIGPGLSRKSPGIEFRALVTTKGLFIKEIEEALLDGRIDLAVHSMKDLPAELPVGLRIAAVPKRADPRDALVGCAWKAVRKGARVGTGSPRRRAQLLHLRPDLEVVPLRGNVETRIRKRQTEGLDAVLLACAGLDRLGLASEIVERLEPSLLLPPPGQGALALEFRAGDAKTEDWIRPLDDSASAAEVRAEREFLRFFGAGCSVPLAALARREGSRLTLEGLVATPDGRRLLRGSETGESEDAGIGRRLGEKLLALGAREILPP